MPVRRRGPGARRHGPLHQREVAAGLVRHGLERHHVSPGGQQVSLSRRHDASHASYLARPPLNYPASVADLLAEAEAELYTADPDGFTARRSELAQHARDAGEPAVAKKITALRKPTRSAWVVNRLVRSDPDVRSRLDSLAADLRDASGGSRLRELTAARAKLVDELTRTALEGLPVPPASLREEVTATFDAAIADPGVAASLGTPGPCRPVRGLRRLRARRRRLGPAAAADQGAARARGRARGPPPGENQRCRTGPVRRRPRPRIRPLGRTRPRGFRPPPGSRTRRRAPAPGRGAAAVLPGRVPAAAGGRATQPAEGVNHLARPVSPTTREAAGSWSRGASPWLREGGRK